MRSEAAAGKVMIDGHRVDGCRRAASGLSPLVVRHAGLAAYWDARTPVCERTRRDAAAAREAVGTTVGLVLLGGGAPWT